MVVIEKDMGWAGALEPYFELKLWDALSANKVLLNWGVLGRSLVALCGEIDC